MRLSRIASKPLSHLPKNSLAVQLRHLELALRAARIQMATPQDDILFSRRGVPELLRGRLEPLINQALAEIRLLAERFDLENETEDLRAILRAEMAEA